MILAIAFAHVWGVIQLIVLGSLSRTIRVRTVLAALTVGLYAIGPLTVFLQLGWIHLAASLLGTPVAQIQSIASYTVDPFLEEALKLLPLAMLLLLIPTVRRQWSVVDCVLIAAATGSGYGLAENLYRYAGSPHSAHGIAGGWAIVIGRHALLVPGILNTLTSWLPAGTVSADEAIGMNPHLVWSAIGGFAVGLIVRRRTRAARFVAGGLLFYIGLDHAAGNAALSRDTWLSPLTAPLHALATLGGFMAVAALVAAWWLDRISQPTAEALEPLLAAERSASSRIEGTLKAAVSRLPWSIFWVGGFTRARRAWHAARAASHAGPDDLHAALVAQRDQIDRALTQPTSPSLLPSGLTPPALRSALRRPEVIMSLVFLAPSILYLIIGGFPQTAGIQRVITGPVVWPLVLLITVATQARMAWSVIVRFRNWSKARRLPIGDDAALVGLQLACGVGAVGLGGFTLMRVFGGLSAGSSLISGAHGADAANRLQPGGGLSVANSGGAFAPPPPSLDLPDAAPAAPAAQPAPAAPGNAPSPAAQPQSHPPAPKSNPNNDAAANAAAKAAADADARAAQADADALAAQRFRQDAIRAADAADIAKATADPGDDPGVAAARERTRQANAASEAADQGALDPDDPWDPNAPNKTAADMFQKAAREAADEQRAAENAFEERMAKDAAEAKAAADVAEKGVNEAADTAATARQEAADAHAAAARAADPLGAAADQAEKDYAAAHARENQAFEEPDAKAYQDAREAAMLAKEKADAARAAANAARDARSAMFLPVDKP
jgi:hypothetical protein